LLYFWCPSVFSPSCSFPCSVRLDSCQSGQPSTQPHLRPFAPAQ
jgi:hypothetical protein